MATKNNNDVILSYSCTVSGNNAVFSMKLDNNETLSFDSSAYPPAVIAELLAYGLKQKLVDSVAGRTSKGWTAAEVSEKLTSLHNAMREGSFTSRTPGQALATQVEVAKARLETYLSKSAEDKALMAEVGVTEAALRKALNSLATKLAKSLSSDH